MFYNVYVCHIDYIYTFTGYNYIIYVATYIYTYMHVCNICIYTITVVACKIYMPNVHVVIA